MIHLSLSLKHSTATQKSAFFQELLYFLCLFIFERGDTTEKERRGEDIIFTKLNLFENILVYWNYENSKQADWGYFAVAVQSKKKTSEEEERHCHDTPEHEFRINFLYMLDKSTFLYKALFMSHSYLGPVGGNVDSAFLKPSCS